MEIEKPLMNIAFNLLSSAKINYIFKPVEKT